MSWSFVRREWGAVTFVLTVAIGIVIVPLALYFGNQRPAPVSLPTTPPTASAPERPAPPPQRANLQLPSKRRGAKALRRAA